MGAKISASDRTRTGDLNITSVTRYHCATEAIEIRQDLLVYKALRPVLFRPATHNRNPRPCANSADPRLADDIYDIENRTRLCFSLGGIFFFLFLHFRYSSRLYNHVIGGVSVGAQWYFEQTQSIRVSLLETY